MNSIVTILGVVCIALASFVFTGCQEKGEIKIGAVLPLTGSAAVWGQNARMGLELALEEINGSGGVNSRMIKIYYEDSESDPQKAVSALNKLNAQGVKLVIGDIASSSVLAMAPIAEANKIILLSPGASNPDITNAGDFIFRNWQSDALEGKVDAEFAFNTLKARKAAVISVNNAYGQGLHQVFVKRFRELGGEIGLEETFDQGATDMRTQINKLMAVNVDLLYLPGYPPEMAIFLRQAKELGLKLPILSVQAFDDPQILRTAGNAAEGVMFSVPKPPDTTTNLVRNFIDNYRKKFNAEPGVCSNTGYDALYLLAHAIKEGNSSKPESVRDQLYKIKDFPGAAGLTTFDANGDVIRPFIFKTVKSSEFVLFQ